jgi:hypothetical protein
MDGFDDDCGRFFGDVSTVAGSVAAVSHALCGGDAKDAVTPQLLPREHDGENSDRHEDRHPRRDRYGDAFSQASSGARVPLKTACGARLRISARAIA